MINRRDSLLGLGALASAAALARHSVYAMAAEASVAPYRTPYKYPRLVLAKSDEPHSFDSKLVDDPFVFRAAERFYMTYLGHDGTGYQVGLAESEDLLNWRKLGMILGREPTSRYRRYNVAMASILRNDDLFSPGTLKKVNGRYLGVWHAYPEAGYEQGAAVIGLAWSDDFRRWALDEPILSAQDGAVWERGGLYKAYVTEVEGLYHLYYNAKDKRQWPWFEQIGVATSSDLKHWVRYRGNPIVPHGSPGAWDERFASNPAVVRHGAMWAMFYFGLSRDGKARELVALGPDPLHFTKVNEVLVGPGPAGSIDAQYAHKPCVICWQGDLYHFYCAVSGGGEDAHRGIAVARSRAW